MVSITITEKGGQAQYRHFDQPEITVGRVQGNDIVLPKSNISKRHARIVDNDGTLVVIDTKSTNGTYVNGNRIGAPQDLDPGDRVQVGDFTLEVATSAAEASQAARGEPSPGGQRQAQTQDLADADLDVPRDAGGHDGRAGRDADFGQEDGLGRGAADVQAADLSQAAPDSARIRPSHTPAWQQTFIPEDSGQSATPPPRPQGSQQGHGPGQGLDRGQRSHGGHSSTALADRWDGAHVDAAPLAPRPAHPALPGGAAPAETLARQEASGSVSLPEASGSIVETVHARLRQSFAPAPSGLGPDDAEAHRVRTQEAVRAIVADMEAAGELPQGMQTSLLCDCVLGEALGLGPLEELLADNSVTEILVNHARQIYVERAGRLEPCDMVFSGDLAVMGVIERIVAPLGRRIDAKHPMVDARLKDGSRVNAIIPPLAVRGPSLTIRKFSREPLQIDDLVAGGTLNADMAEFLETCVKARKNIVVAGGTGSGKTTLLNVLSSFIGAQERIITIEDAAELKLDQVHVVSLESRPATADRGVDGANEVSIRDLVRNALRMRPDRIIVGECRGGEALDMLQAMNTGHDGSLTTVHANGPREALSRMETLVLMAGIDLPARAVREQVAGAIHVVVQQARLMDGTRRITHISEITGMEGEVISSHNLFTFEQQGVGVDGRVQGRFRATGVMPKFYEGLRANGIKVNLAIFRNT